MKIIEEMYNLLKSHHVIIFVLHTIQLCSTGMAQRQRAGLITPRSQDRNLLPVKIFSSTKSQYFFEDSPSSAIPVLVPSGLELVCFVAGLGVARIPPGTTMLTHLESCGRNICRV